MSACPRIIALHPLQSPLQGVVPPDLDVLSHNDVASEVDRAAAFYRLYPLFQWFRLVLLSVCEDGHRQFRSHLAAVDVTVTAHLMCQSRAFLKPCMSNFFQCMLTSSLLLRFVKVRVLMTVVLPTPEAPMVTTSCEGSRTPLAKRVRAKNFQVCSCTKYIMRWARPACLQSRQCVEKIWTFISASPLWRSVTYCTYTYKHMRKLPI